MVGISLGDKSVKQFDLNIEKILEDWEVFHALREVIANALDEQVLTGTANVEITVDKQGQWHIRDFGRGLKYEHLTQKENSEKLSSSKTIGKFGLGLKDALATFDRHKVKVLIKSKHGDITFGTTEKYGFEDIKTLHAFISKPSDPDFKGTEFILTGVTDEDIKKAKDLFLKFSKEKVLEDTKYGEILEKKEKYGRIYINGVKVAEEENFLFSYNITALNENIRKALNRERSNVGRAAYSDRVRKILVTSKSKEVAEILSEDLKNYEKGEIHDELKWLEVQLHAVKILNSYGNILFLTPSEIKSEAMMIDEAKRSGYRIIPIPANLRLKIMNQQDIKGKPIMDLGQFVTKYNNSFEFKFVDYNDLTSLEQKIIGETDRIFALIGGKPKIIREIKVSETMRKELGSQVETLGIWEGDKHRIIIKREVLSSLATFSGTLLHEVTHAISGAGDVSREFEIALTHLIGKIVESLYGYK